MSNLIEQYNEIVCEIFLYEKFIKKDLFFRLNPIEIFNTQVGKLGWLKDILLGKENSTWLGLNIYSEKNTPPNKEMIRRRLEEESPYYKIAINDYPLNELCDYLKVEFPDVNFSKLLKVHDKWGSTSIIVQFSSKFTIASFAVWSYANFTEIRSIFSSSFFNDKNFPSILQSFSLAEIGVIGFTVIISFFLSFVLLVSSKSRRRKVRHILEYAAIKQEIS